MPAKPKKIERQKGDEPAVTILLVDRPFTAELQEKDKPKRADGGDNQRSASKRALASCGYGLCLRENGIQFALIISQKPSGKSAAGETFYSGAL